MKFTETKLPGVILLQPTIHRDGRGYFYENYNEREFAANGIDAKFVQDNQSYSNFRTIRGLHFQDGEHAQAKLVRVLRGKVLDVAVDVRPNSPTFGKHVAVELSASNQKMLFIPRGFAHGFSVLSDNAIFSYKCDNFYNKESERGIVYNDPTLKIDWKIPNDYAYLSEKDKLWPTFREYKQWVK